MLNITKEEENKVVFFGVLPAVTAAPDAHFACLGYWLRRLIPTRAAQLPPQPVVLCGVPRRALCLPWE